MPCQKSTDAPCQLAASGRKNENASNFTRLDRSLHMLKNGMWEWMTDTTPDRIKNLKRGKPDILSGDSRQGHQDRVSNKLTVLV